jgi:hypothetical protein
MENVGIFYGHLEYFTAIWCTLWSLVISCDNLVYFTPFWYIYCVKKNLATLSRASECWKSETRT